MPESIDDLAKKQRQILINRVALQMKLFYHGDPMKIQHFVRVYTLARSIGELERLPDEEQEYLELAALVHGVGGDDPMATVREILTSCGIDDEAIAHVCHIVTNMDSYDHIASLDHQIFVEARSIVDFKEQDVKTDEIVKTAEKRFITNTGKLFLKRAFDV